MSNQLHQRLKLARHQRGLSLDTIARERGVREYNLVLIEQNAFEQLPTGLYGRNAVRAYAAAVGFSPDEAIAEVGQRLREPEDPINGLARVRGITRPAAKRPFDLAPAAARHGPAVLPWRPQVAALIDLGILAAIDLALLQLTALAAGVRAPEILRSAFPALVLLFTLIPCVYFILLGGVRRATIGARITQAPAYEHMLDGHDAHTVIQRSLQYAVAEVASLAMWIVTTDHARHWMRTLREKRA